MKRKAESDDSLENENSKKRRIINNKDNVEFIVNPLLKLN